MFSTPSQPSDEKIRGLWKITINPWLGGLELTLHSSKLVPFLKLKKGATCIELKCPLSSRQNTEKRKAGTIRRWPLFLFDSNRQEFHRCHTAKSLLVSFTVVKMDVWSNRITKLIILVKMIQVVYLRFQNSPKALHRRIIQTFAWTRYTLTDSSLFHCQRQWYNARRRRGKNVIWLSLLFSRVRKRHS